MRLACVALLAALATPAAAAPNLVSRVALREAGGAVVLEIEGSRPPTFTTFASEAPPRFVVDVSGAELGPGVRELSPGDGPVEAVRASMVDGRPGVARVAVSLRGALEGAEVSTRGNALLVTFPRAAALPAALAGPAEPPAASPARAPAVAAAPARAPAVAAAPARAPAPAATRPAPPPEPRVARAARPAEPPAARPARQEIRGFGFRQLPDASRVYVRTAAAPRFTVEERGERLVVLRLDDARAARANDARPLDTAFFASAVERVTPRREAGGYVLEIALRDKVAYRQHVDGDELAIDFELPARTPAP